MDRGKPADNHALQANVAMIRQQIVGLSLLPGCCGAFGKQIGAFCE
jgi:hypothetical protein